MAAALVSVLMPVLNEERTITSAIHSVLHQTGVEVEVLVADGGSSDATRAVVADLAQRHPGIHLLDNPRGIIPSGLNVGLAQAQGEFVARVDGHCNIAPDNFARAVEHLRRDTRLAGVGGLRRGVGDCRTGRAVALALSSRFGVGDSINHYATRYQLTDHASMGVYRTQLARQVGGWDESLAVNEDVDFDHRLLGTGHTIAFDPGMVTLWQVRRNVSDLFRQYRRYGAGKAAMVRKNGRRALRARHLAAPGAVVAVTVLVPLSVRWPRLLAGLLPYVSLLGLASWRAWGRRPELVPVAGWAVPASFLAMHSGWGLGFIEGLVLNRRPAAGSARPPVSSLPPPEGRRTAGVEGPR